MDAKEEGEASKNATFFEWLCVTPTALQVVVHLFQGFLKPGVLWVLLKHWQELTRSFWSSVLGWFTLDLEGFEPMLDLLTLTLLVLFSGLAAKGRLRKGMGSNLAVEYKSANTWGKRRIAFRSALIIFAFISIFNFGEVLLRVGAGSQGYVYRIFGFYFLSFVYIYCCSEFHLGVDFKKIAGELDQKRTAGQLSPIIFVGIPGLLYRAGTPVIICLIAVASMGYLSPGMVRGFLVGGLGIGTVLLAASFYRFGWPSAASIMGDSKRLIGSILIIGLAMLPLAPFTWGVISHFGEERRTLIVALMVIGGVSFAGAFVFLIKVSRKVPRNILIIVALLASADRLLTLAVSLVPE